MDIHHRARVVDIGRDMARKRCDQSGHDAIADGSDVWIDGGDIGIDQFSIDVDER
jgi:hypothetical protein